MSVSHLSRDNLSIVVARKETLNLFERQPAETDQISRQRAGGGGGGVEAVLHNNHVHYIPIGKQ